MMSSKVEWLRWGEQQTPAKARLHLAQSPTPGQARSSKPLPVSWLALARLALTHPCVPYTRARSLSVSWVELPLFPRRGNSRAEAVVPASSSPIPTPSPPAPPPLSSAWTPAAQRLLLSPRTLGVGCSGFHIHPVRTAVSQQPTLSLSPPLVAPPEPLLVLTDSALPQVASAHRNFPPHSQEPRKPCHKSGCWPLVQGKTLNVAQEVWVFCLTLSPTVRALIAGITTVLPEPLTINENKLSDLKPQCKTNFFGGAYREFLGPTLQEFLFSDSGMGESICIFQNSPGNGNATKSQTTLLNVH